MAAGVKFTVRLNVEPTATTSGRFAAPPKVNDCPDTLTLETWTAVEPWLTRDTVALAVCPTVTLPNATVLGDAENEPELPVATWL